MATQTEGQIQTEIKDVIAFIHECRKFGYLNSSGNISNLVARMQTVLNDTEGDFSGDMHLALSQARAAIAGVLVKEFGQALVTPLLRNYAKVVGTITETDALGILKRLYQRAVATGTTFTVKSRNLSYGSVSAGSNLGNGTINRLTVDAYGYNLEACYLGAKRADCTKDEQTGAQLNEEVLLFRGPTKLIDSIQVQGSGVDQEVACFSARQALITNASFSGFGGSITSLTDLSGWTPGSGAGVFTNINLDQTNYYRGAGGQTDPTPTALKLLTNEYVSQNFDVNAVNLDPDAPCYHQLAYNRSVGSCNGTLTFTVGLDSVSVALASAGAGWNILRMAATKMRYPRNFAAMNEPVVKVQLSGRTSGTLLVDDIIFQQYALVDGLYYAPVGGSTAFVGENRDSFTWTDALAGSDSILQQYFFLLFDFSFPSSNVGAETWTDPSV